MNNIQRILLFLIFLLNKSNSILNLIKNHNAYEEYLTYCKNYKKEPSSFRFIIWRARVKKLKLKNKLHSIRKNFKAGFSKFTDLTQQERKNYTKPLKTSKFPISKQNSPKLKGPILKTLKETKISKSIRSTTNSLRARIRRYFDTLKNRVLKRSEKFLSTFIKTNSQEKNWLALNKLPPIKNQDTCGSCWAFAITASIESLYLIKTEQSLNLSEQELVDCADFMDCDGGWNDLAIEYVVKNGISLEADYPYINADGICDVPEGEKVEIEGYRKIESGDMQEFLKVLDEHPVAVAVQVEDDFYDYESGVIDADSLCGVTRNVNHAVLAVGYFISEDFEENYILFRNQWGEEWGDGGYFKFKFYDDKYDNGPCNILMYMDHTVYPVL